MIRKAYAQLGFLSLLLIGLLLFGLIHVNWVNVSRSWTTTFDLKEFGVTGYIFHDMGTEIEGWWLVHHLSGLDVGPYRKFLVARHREGLKKFITAAPTDKRYVIFIQMEAIAASVLRARNHRKPIAPFLKQLASQSIWFKNAFDETDAGRTADAEFAVLTSEVPIQGKPAFTSENLAHVPSVPKQFDKAGYNTISVHGFISNFWKRATNHRRLGYKKQYYLNDLDKRDIIGWGVSDRSLMQQAADILASQHGRVFMHIITLSSHHPFDFVRQKFGLPNKGIVNDYYRSVHYLDGAVRLFFNRLKHKGLLKHCVIALYGDHDSGITSQLAEAMHEPNKNPAAHDKIVMLVYGLGRPRVVTHPSGLEDLGPTILSGLGLSVPMTFVGGTPTSDMSALLPGGRQIVKVAPNGDPVYKPATVDLKKLTLLSIYRSGALAAHPGKHE